MYSHVFRTSMDVKSGVFGATHGLGLGLGWKLINLMHRPASAAGME